MEKLLTILFLLPFLAMTVRADTKYEKATFAGGQFADGGSQYKTAVFYHDDAQKAAAEESKEALERSGKFDKPIMTAVIKASKFYPAEAYHQDYSEKNPERYKLYKTGSGREDYFLKRKLTPKQDNVGL